MILRSVTYRGRYELPHGNARVTDERHQLVISSLPLSTISSWHGGRGMRQEAWLCSHGFNLLLHLLLFFLQPLLLNAKLILLSLKKISYLNPTNLMS